MIEHTGRARPPFYRLIRGRWSHGERGIIITGPTGLPVAQGFRTRDEALAWIQARGEADAVISNDLTTETGQSGLERLPSRRNA
jgi:hypothetical protein